MTSDICCASSCEFHQYKYGLCYSHYRVNKTLIIRESLFDILGRSCVLCGNTDIDVLQFDHINNDGYKDRGKEQYYINNPVEARKTLQVLCANCHIKKHISIKRKYGEIETWKI